jgi:hypothetical protein
MVSRDGGGIRCASVKPLPLNPGITLHCSRHRKDTAVPNDLKHILPLLIPIVGIIMGVGLAMLAVWTDFSRKREMFEMHHKERLLAIERGLEVPPLPPEFFRSGRVERGPADLLRWGLTWLLVGLALIVALAWNQGDEMATWGLLPVAVGIAQLVTYAVTSRRSTSPPAQAESLDTRKPI